MPAAAATAIADRPKDSRWSPSATVDATPLMAAAYPGTEWIVGRPGVNGAGGFGHLAWRSTRTDTAHVVVLHGAREPSTSRYRGRDSGESRSRGPERVERTRDRGTHGHRAPAVAAGDGPPIYVDLGTTSR